MSKWEIRSLNSEAAEVRAGDSRDIKGRGIVFNSESQDLGGFTEVILPEAIEGVIEQSDVLALMNHDISKGVLARSYKGTGSMSLTVDSRGVNYSFKAPNYNLGQELLEGIERGDIRASSFAFTVAPGGEKFEKREDGTWLRTIHKFDRIYDMSPVYSPAYLDTTVAKRSIEELQNLENPISEAVKPVVGDEPAPEPIIVMEDRSASDLELRFKQYLQEAEFNELTK